EFQTAFELSKDTIDCLKSERFTTKAALRGLINETIDSFSLKAGEKAALKVGVSDLKVRCVSPGKTASDSVDKLATLDEMLSKRASTV
ncbi:hypothetical protein BaRGS_00023312, partial [Batillaria attramentaria]